MSTIQLKDVNLTFNSADSPVEALSEINLDIEPGQFVTFIGPSGCGKTTLLRAIADLEQITSGEITINSLPPSNARLSRQYGFVFQSPTLYPWRTVEENVQLPLEIFKESKSKIQSMSAKSLDLVHLTDFAKKYPWQLSGGMRQRVSIARALSFEAPILLMDEPFGALDEITRDYMNVELLQLWQKTKKTVLFVTHSISEAVFLSTTVVVMSKRPGKIIRVLDTSSHLNRRLDPGFKDSTLFIDNVRDIRQSLRNLNSSQELR